MTRTLVLDAIASGCIVVNVVLAIGNFVLRRKLTAALRDVAGPGKRS